MDILFRVQLVSKLRSEMESMEEAHQQELAEIQEEVLKEISSNESERETLSLQVDRQEHLLSDKEHQIRELKDGCW